MATMILVEDESFERNALRHCIDWNLIGVQIIGEAANGAQGLSLVMDLRPDIVLTDVKMPVMDGIEMARRIRQFSEETKILFVSSYDDFEYAKQAIDLAIKAYIMKPVNEAELLRVVKKAVDEVTGSALEKRMYNKISNNYTVSLSLARQALVTRLLNGVSALEEDIASLGMDWLHALDGLVLCLFLTLYSQSQPDVKPIPLKEMNRRSPTVCSQCVHVCINPGNLITLCAFSPAEAETGCLKMEAFIQDFLTSSGYGEMRIESVRSAPGGEGGAPADLYAEILRRNMAGYAVPSEWNEKRKSKRQTVEMVEQIIQQEYQQPLTLENIAQRIHFTPNYLGTIFKAEKKLSINRYLMRVRMTKAEELLRQSMLSVNEIAEQCGFGSITYFHTTFKKEKGVTPAEFRRSAGDRP